MPTARTLRLNELLQRELSGLLRREYQTEAVVITITSVDVAPDLRSCNVFVAVTGDATLIEDRLRWLRRQAAALRATLSRRVVLQHLPALTFVPDTSTPRGNRILAVLDEIAAKEKSSAPAFFSEAISWESSSIETGSKPFMISM